MALTQADSLVVVGIAVAGVVGIGTVLATRAFGNRKARLAITCEATSLLPDDVTLGPNADLAVTFKGKPVVEPYLVKLRILNVGPKDVPTTSFDAGRNLILNLNCLIYGALEISHPDRTLHTVSTNPASEAVIQMKPGLLRRGEAWYFEGVFGGEPELKIDSPLIDTDIVFPRPGTDIVVVMEAFGVVFPLPGLKSMVRLLARSSITR